MGKMKIELKKCWTVEADDYHCFTEAQDYYLQAGIKADYEEIGLDIESSNYIAVFWIGTQTKEVKQYIKEWEEKLTEQEEEEEDDESDLRTVTVNGVTYREIKD